MYIFVDTHIYVTNIIKEKEYQLASGGHERSSGRETEKGWREDRGEESDYILFQLKH